MTVRDPQQPSAHSQALLIDLQRAFEHGVDAQGAAGCERIAARRIERTSPR